MDMDICQELLLRVEGCPGAYDACTGLGLGAEDSPYISPDAIIQPLDPGVGKAIRLVKYERSPGIVCPGGVLLYKIHVENAVCCPLCKRYSARVILPVTNWVIAVVSPVGVDSPEPLVGAIDLPISVWGDTEFVTDSLVPTAVIGVI